MTESALRLQKLLAKHRGSETGTLYDWMLIVQLYKMCAVKLFVHKVAHVSIYLQVKQ